MSSDESDDPGVRRTTDAAVVRSVVEARGGYPAHEPQTEGQGDRGLLQIGRHGRNEDLKEISWDAFREEFEGKDLVFVYPDDRSAAAEIDEVGELRKRSAQ